MFSVHGLCEQLADLEPEVAYALTVSASNKQDRDDLIDEEKASAYVWETAKKIREAWERKHNQERPANVFKCRKPAEREARLQASLENLFCGRVIRNPRLHSNVTEGSED